VRGTCAQTHGEAGDRCSGQLRGTWDEMCGLGFGG